MDVHGAGAKVVSLWKYLTLREYNFSLALFATASQQPADRSPRRPINLGFSPFGRSDSGEFVGIYDAMRIQLFSLIPCYSRPIRGATVVSLWDSLMLRDTTLTVTVLSETQGSGFERTGSPTSAMIGQSE